MSSRRRHLPCCPVVYRLCFWVCYTCIHLHILRHASITAANPSPDFSPSKFSYKHPWHQANNNDDDTNNDTNEINLGTTLVAIKYSNGVIVGADTRTSVGGYVSNKLAYKINPIFEPEEESSSSSSSSCVLCRSGSAADTQWLAKQAKRRFRARQLERPRYRPSISEVANFLRYKMKNSKDKQGSNSDYQASLICAGYDSASKGGQIFGITPGGSLWEEDNFCVSGSGSTILLGYLDDALHQAQENNFASELTEEEAIRLVTKLLRLSIARDGSSGGLVRLYVINENGLDERTVYPFMNAKSSTTTTTSGAEEENKFAELKGFAAPS